MLPAGTDPAFLGSPRRCNLEGLMLLAIALAASAATATTDPPASVSRHEARPRPARHSSFRTPGIRVWISGSDLRRRGDRVQVYYRTERDAYVTIFRIDTDGRVQLLFPRDPSEENYGYGGATYSVSNYDRHSAFYVDDYPGVGYIFAVASTDPFNYHPILNGGRWDLHVVSDGRIHGDPRSEMEEIAVQLMESDYADFDTHLLPYYVEQRYDYPRFVCYDCHTYTPFAYWDPYLAWCRRFTLVVYRDPYYYYPSYWYPTRYYGGRYYGGTQVVYTQPRGSRYIFKNRDNSAPGVDYRDRRTTETATSNRRTVDERGVRGIDLGGRGSVPAPRTPTRREAPDLQDTRGERPASRDARLDDSREPPVVGGGDPRRRAEGNGQQPQSGGSEGSRRRIDGQQPGIEIVPAPRRQGGTEQSRSQAAPASAERRGSGEEPRPPRPDYVGRVQRSLVEREDLRVEPKTRTPAGGSPQPERTRAETRPEPSASERGDTPRLERRSPQEQPEGRPQQSPPRVASPQRESRPQQREASPQRESRPPQREASPPRETRPSSPPPQSRPSPPPPSSRPQSGSQSGGSQGSSRRRP